MRASKTGALVKPMQSLINKRDEGTDVFFRLGCRSKMRSVMLIDSNHLSPLLLRANQLAKFARSLRALVLAHQCR